ncbi:translocation protein SEC62-like isoform X2 [Branchiostoma floridae x Branchiostoma japonicum]
MSHAQGAGPDDPMSYPNICFEITLVCSREISARLDSAVLDKMAERRKKKQRAKDVDSDGVSKEETAVGKYLRFNVPTKKTSIMRNNVEYFTASKAVDCLLDSKWAEGKGKTEVLFTHRESAVNYCQRLLEKGMFYRAKKMVKKEDKKKKEEKKTEEKKEGKKEKTKEKEKEKEGEKEKTKEKAEEEDTETSGKKEGVEDTPSGKKKKEGKRKIKLEFHEEQVFLDANELYVWVFDPIHPKTFALGLALVVAAVVVVLFPLWPYEARQGVYYLSLAAAFFIGFILFLAVVRLILFCLIWAGTGGHHHFWFLPNLTADVGFLDSFRPLYLYEYKGPDKDKKDDQKDLEETAKGEREEEHVEEVERKEDDKETTEKGEEAPKDQDESGSEKDANDDLEGDEDEEGSEDEDGSESEDQEMEEQREDGNGGGSDTTNGDNGFEVIKKEELEVEGLGDKGQGDVTQTQD